MSSLSLTNPVAAVNVTPLISSTNIEFPTHRRGRPPLQLRRALSTALARIDACEQGSLRVDDLCALAGVSPRTMRTAFQATLGMPPSRYIRRRRLNLVRSALQAAVPGQVTIAAVAHHFGFHDPGRMAADYHELFAEYPSDTLRHREATPAVA